MLKQLRNIVILTLISSCNMSDYSEELSGGYHYCSMGRDLKYISGKNNIHPNVKEYVFDDEYILVCQEPYRFSYKSIFASDLYSSYSGYYRYLKDSVSEKHYKSRKEILKDSTIAKLFKKKKASFENTSEDIKISEEIADSIMKNNPIQRKIFSLKKVYWIIQIKGDVLYGPLTLKEFDALKKEKKIDLDFED